MEKMNPELRRILTLALANISETVGLILWLQFADNQKPIIGIGILVLFLLIERIAVVLVAHELYAGRPFPRYFYQLLILSALVESASWFVWLTLWDNLSIGGLWQPLIPTIVLFVVQLYVHSWTMSFSLNKPPFYRYFRNPLTIVFSAIEALAGGAWLIVARTEKPVLAAVIIFVGITIEHVIQGIAIDQAGQPNFVADAPET